MSDAIRQTSTASTSRRGWAAVLALWAQGFGIACFMTHDRESTWHSFGIGLTAIAVIVSLRAEGHSWRRLSRSGMIPVTIIMVLTLIVVEFTSR